MPAGKGRDLEVMENTMRAHAKKQGKKKLDPGVVLYFKPGSIGDAAGARCGICMMFADGHCTVVEGNIDGARGVCGLYVHGKHSGPSMRGALSKKEAGYAEAGPTHCGSCEYFIPSGSCQIVSGDIEAEGCCNAYEAENAEENAEEEWQP